MAGEARLECRGAPAALPWQKEGGPRPGPPGPRPPLRKRKSAAHERNALSSHGLAPQYFRRGGA